MSRRGVILRDSRSAPPPFPVASSPKVKSLTSLLNTQDFGFTVPRDLTVELAQRLDEGRHTSSEQSSWLLSESSVLPSAALPRLTD